MYHRAFDGKYTYLMVLLDSLERVLKEKRAVPASAVVAKKAVPVLDDVCPLGLSHACMPHPSALP